MATFATLRSLLLGGVALAVTGLVEGGEKIRFGPSTGTALGALPRSAAEPRQIESEHVFNNPQPVQVSAPGAGAVVNVVVQPGRGPVDEDQRNWIFRDTRDAAAVQKALGVETFDPTAATKPGRDDVAAIRDYFGRQQAPASAEPTVSAGLTPGMESRTGVFRNPPLEAPEGGGALFGGGAFRNTLNSDNTAVREYYRNLYTNPDSGVVNGTRGTAGAAPAAPFTPQTAPAPTQSPTFSDFAGRAAFVNSLTPDTPLSSTLNPLTPPQQNAAPSTVPTVNNGTLFERRNGLIDIPGRKF